MSSGFTTGTNEHLIRSNVWSNQLKDLLLDDLYAMQFVKHLTDFPDGAAFNIASLGEAETADFVEGKAVKYNKMDTGNFTFAWDQYKYSANSISEKFKRDSFYASDVLSAFAPRQHRSLMEAVETRILSAGPNGQTASSLNTINSGDHRWVATGSSNILTIKDFMRAQYSLRKANVPMRNLVAVVDAASAYQIQSQANVVSLLSPMPMWEDVIKSGMVTGFKFMFNLIGFDVYVSNYLPSGIAETINSVSVTNGVANQFFSAAPGDTLPVIGGFKQMPTVYSEFNKDLQQEEFLTIAEYAFKLYREENMVVVISDASVIN